MGQSAVRQNVVSTYPGSSVSGFPDVCKTPTPGEPVPVPYPNLAVPRESTSEPARITSTTPTAAFKTPTGQTAGHPAASGSAAMRMARYASRVTTEGNSANRPGLPSQHNLAPDQTEAQQIRTRLQILHGQIISAQGGNPNRWHQLVDEYVILAAALYRALTL